MIQRGIFTGKYTDTPYFYVIEHVASGRLYAGSKYATKRVSDWSTFMRPGGYTTSSKHINTLIKMEGFEAFRIGLLVSEDRLNDVFNPLGHNEVGKYEDWFLEYYNCTADPAWFNKSRGGSIHTKKHRAMMQEYVSGLGITFAQLAAKRSAAAMAKPQNGTTIRKIASQKTAEQRRKTLSYGAYRLTGNSQVIECTGNLHATCLHQLKMPKSVFQELRDTGKITIRKQDKVLAKRDYSSVTPQTRAKILCAQARIKFNGWTCTRLAAPHGQGDF